MVFQSVVALSEQWMFQHHQAQATGLIYSMKGPCSIDAAWWFLAPFCQLDLEIAKEKIAAIEKQGRNKFLERHRGDSLGLFFFFSCLWAMSVDWKGKESGVSWCPPVGLQTEIEEVLEIWLLESALHHPSVVELPVCTELGWFPAVLNLQHASV